MFQKYILYKEGIDVNYTLPSNPQEQMADFYCVSLLNSIDFNTNQYGEMDRNDILKYELNLTTKTLLNSLKQSLLEDLYHVICLEIRHFGEMSIKKNSDFLNKNELEFNDYLIDNSSFFNTSSYDSSFEKMNRAISHFFSTKEDFIKYCYKQFTKSSWEASYGGYQWGEICDAYLKLLNAKNENLLFIYIDHVYDLEHNTGIVFDKLEKYTLNGSYIWIKPFLDFKKNIKHIKQIIEYCSAKMKNLAKRIILVSKEERNYKNEKIDIIMKLDGTTFVEKLVKYIAYEEIKEMKPYDGYHYINKTSYSTRGSFFEKNNDLEVYTNNYIDGRENANIAVKLKIYTSAILYLYDKRINDAADADLHLQRILTENSNKEKFIEMARKNASGHETNKKQMIDFLYNKTLISHDVCNKIVSNIIEIL